MGLHGRGWRETGEPVEGDRERHLGNRTWRTWRRCLDDPVGVTVCWATRLCTSINRHAFYECTLLIAIQLLTVIGGGADPVTSPGLWRRAGRGQTASSPRANTQRRWWRAGVPPGPAWGKQYVRGWALSCVDKGHQMCGKKRSKKDTQVKIIVLVEMEPLINHVWRTHIHLFEV